MIHSRSTTAVVNYYSAIADNNIFSVRVGTQMIRALLIVNFYSHKFLYQYVFIIKCSITIPHEQCLCMHAISNSDDLVPSQV